MINKLKLILDFRLFLFVPALVMMCVIFSFSSDTGEESASLSLNVTTEIVNTVDTVIYDNSLGESKVNQLISQFHFPVRKMAHMSEYALLALTIFLPLFAYKIRFSIAHYISPVLICFIYACTDEFHQLRISERSGQFTDVLIDTSGSIIMIFLMFIITKIVQKVVRKKQGL